MKFKYTAINNKNQEKTGAIEAETKNQAITLLRDRGLVVKELVEANGSDEPTSIWQMDLGGDIHERKIKKKRLLQMMNQLAMMMKAGINLSLSMEIMIEGEKNKDIKAILKEINADLYNGLTLSQAMRTFKCFPPILISIIEAGEANGRIDLAFEQCALITQKEMALSGKIKSAMMYPCFLIVLTLAVVVVLCMFVLPTFAGVYTDFGAELPALTAFMMGFSDFLIANWLFILIGIAIIVVAFIMLKKNSADFRMLLAKILLKVPLVGPISRQNSLARFCRLMSTLTDAGIAIHTAMELSKEATPNLYIQTQIQEVLDDVRLGITINAAMAKHPVFDNILVSMIRVGEESGMLGDSLFKMAEMFESQADESTGRMTEMMTPIMTVFIGVMVGIVVVSMILPMFGMYDVIGSST